MGTKNNPGDYDCYENAEPDEPMFVLLARDVLAPGLVRMWVDHRRLMASFKMKSVDEQKMQEALDCADAMEAWRKEP